MVLLSLAYVDMTCNDLLPRIIAEPGRAVNRGNPAIGNMRLCRQADEETKARKLIIYDERDIRLPSAADW